MANSSTRHRLLTDLRLLLAAYATRHNLTPSTVTKKILGDGKFAARLEAGDDMRVGTYDRAIDAFAKAWPEDLVWPEKVPVPETLKRSA